MLVSCSYNKRVQLQQTSDLATKIKVMCHVEPQLVGASSNCKFACIQLKLSYTL